MHCKEERILIILYIQHTALSHRFIFVNICNYFMADYQYLTNEDGPIT